jgi:hypothetical protein
MKAFIIISIMALLSGCTYTKADLKADPKNPLYRVEVAQNYQGVYRQIHKMARKCMETGDATIHGDIYLDVKEATIEQRRISVDYGIDLMTSLIEIKGIDDQRTELALQVATGMYSRPVTTPAIDDLLRWINGDQECLKTSN